MNVCIDMSICIRFLKVYKKNLFLSVSYKATHHSEWHRKNRWMVEVALFFSNWVPLYIPLPKISRISLCAESLQHMSSSPHADSTVSGVSLWSSSPWGMASVLSQGLNRIFFEYLDTVNIFVTV